MGEERDAARGEARKVALGEAAEGKGGGEKRRRSSRGRGERERGGCIGEESVEEREWIRGNGKGYT